MDDQTLAYLRLTGRSDEQVALVEAYAKAQGLRTTRTPPARTYAEVIEFDLGAVERSIAGPSRPARPHPAGRGAGALPRRVR